MPKYRLICTVENKLLSVRLPGPKGKVVRCPSCHCHPRYKTGFECPICNRRYSVDSAVADRAFKCPRCQTILDQVPLEPLLATESPSIFTRLFRGEAFYQRQARRHKQENELWPSVSQRHRHEIQRWKNDVVERKAQGEWALWHEKMEWSRVSRLPGRDFEKFLLRLFVRLGYKAELTRATGDQGADLLLRDQSGAKIAVQAKRHRARISNRAVQELLGAIAYYKCPRGIVVSTSDFTAGAEGLAEECLHIELWGPKILRERMKEAFPDETPPFSWDAYRRLKSQMEPESDRKSNANAFDGFPDL